jgi:hypothetical protein
MADNIPPKLDLRKTGLAQPNVPAAAGIPSASAGLTSKRETSRIPINLAAPEPPTVAKRTTARISLDAVLGEGAPAVQSDGAPKTIRLKRPGETAGVRLGPAVGASDTEGAGSSPTVRKTVRLKRSPVAGGPQPVAVARASGTELAEDVAAMAAPAERVSFVFPLVAVAAVFAAVAVIWMLCAQVFGPDLSMTQLASGKLRGLDLPWPGKIVGVR